MVKPPAQVTTAVLRGGPLHGIQVEIDPGQTRLDSFELLLAGEMTDELARTPYHFSGEVQSDDEHRHGLAVFVPVEE